MKLFPCTFIRRKPMLILSNGSERGDFVPIDYVTRRFGRIHDGIQVLKAYYPHHPQWSQHKKISSAATDAAVRFAWDYDYEDYYPFNLNVPGGDCRAQFEDIKRHGADIHLTLTMDLSLSDRDIEEVVRSLDGLGRVFLRINHETNGDWFHFHKYYGYKEIGEFFVRCHRIVKANSSTVFTVFSIGGDFFARSRVVQDVFLRLKEDELREALEIADYWSIDRYTSLHFAWPVAATFDRSKTDTYFDNTVEDWWMVIEECYLSMIWHNRLTMKPLFINEFNTDADVNGPEAQADTITRVYDRLIRGDFKWLVGIALYQFRDHGGLGLETGDRREFRENPSFRAYREAVKKFKYEVRLDDWREWPHDKYYSGWFNSDSIRGLCVRESGGAAFVNNFPHPVYVVDAGQSWTLLPPGERADLSKTEEFYLVLPPSTDQTGRLQYAYKLEDVKNNLGRMIKAE